VPGGKTSAFATNEEAYKMPRKKRGKTTSQGENDQLNMYEYAEKRIMSKRRTPIVGLLKGRKNY